MIHQGPLVSLRLEHLRIHLPQLKIQKDQRDQDCNTAEFGDKCASPEPIADGAFLAICGRRGSPLNAQDAKRGWAFIALDVIVVVMTSDELIERWEREEAERFSGWDFTHLAGRHFVGPLPWDYSAQARAFVARCRDVLDIATGGGEVFSALAPFPGRASAVEGYEPNIAVARARLEPLGVGVHCADEVSHLPFSDGAFDLVLNRHGGLSPIETARVLRRDGTFLTQQVGGDNLSDLMSLFGADPKWPDNTLAIVSEKLAAIGFEIRRAEEWRRPIVFRDVGALVYFLKAVPWVVDDFSVATQLDALLKLQRRLERGEPLAFIESHFLIEAVKR